MTRLERAIAILVGLAALMVATPLLVWSIVAAASGDYGSAWLLALLAAIVPWSWLALFYRGLR